MPISQENKTESENFMDALNNMLEIIDAISPLISDNNYLQLCNNLKKLNDNKTRGEVIQYIEVVRETVENNPVVRQHRARSRMKVKTQTEMLSDAEKIKRGWKICPNCDRLVLNISNHQYSDVCKRTAETKKLSHRCNLLQTDKYTIIIHKLRAVFIKYEGFKWGMKFIKNKI